MEAEREARKKERMEKEMKELRVVGASAWSASWGVVHGWSFAGSCMGDKADDVLMGVCELLMPPVLLLLALASHIHRCTQTHAEPGGEAGRDQGKAAADRSHRGGSGAAGGHAQGHQVSQTASQRWW